MATPNVLILRAPGTNCDGETEFAFQRAGALTERLHLNRLRETPSMLRRFQILVVPGGFSYGDDIGAGKIFANQLAHFLGDGLRQFRDAGKLILGVCNGFQILLKAGLLLPADEDGPIATLTHNASGKFEDRWITLGVAPGKCPFLKGCERLYLPVAHAEGQFLCRENWIAEGLKQTDQLVLRYTADDGSTPGYPANPNGSQNDIAGVCDITGQVLGLMPHPERFVMRTQHPRWTRLPELPEEGDGMKLFRNAVDYFR